MEIKATHMTDEYAAHYLLKQGYLAGRIETLQAKSNHHCNWCEGHDAPVDLLTAVRDLLEKVKDGD